MKLKIFLLLFFFSFSIQFRAQIEFSQPNCIEGFRETAYNGQIGGYLLSSSGQLNILIIFVQFPDDSFDINNPYWPKGQAPTNASQWINQTWSINPIQGSLTHYFNDMSFNKFKLTGKTISVITPHSRQWYLNNGKNRGFINKEAILKVDSVMSFAEFDSWDLISEYNHRNQPDGIVDMIIMVYRNIANEFPDSIKKIVKNSLLLNNNYGDLYGPEFTVDNGLRRVKTGF